VLTGNNIAGSLSPGIFYATDQEILTLNISGGAGYFLSPLFAIGGDLGYLSIDDESLLTVAPYVKFVTGMEDNRIGFIGEFSPGFVTNNFGDANFLQLALFLGGHVPFARSAAFQLGAQLSRLDDFEDFGEGEFVFGLRYGLSVYLP
jgi:hypothetical protein